MAGTLNKVMLIGHLGDEVKMHYFDGRKCYWSIFLLPQTKLYK